MSTTMIQIIADTHTHTVANTHAYSTINENAAVAARKGVRFIAMTEHGPAMPSGPHIFHFDNLHKLPDIISGVGILKGCEANVIDYDGALDIPEKTLEKMDWVIASLHLPCIPSSTVEDHTRVYKILAQNPYVDVFGHTGTNSYIYDYEDVIKVFKEYDKIVEINANSIVVRPGSHENCIQIARLCKKWGVPVVANSDAHYCEEIGKVDVSLQLLEEIDFPHDLILNADFDRFKELAQQKSGRSYEGVNRQP